MLFVIDLKDFHDELLDILLEFDRICRKHNINYSLAYGTLLGAIRHNGFIPWDDDVDIMMERNEFDKFCSICSSELDECFFFQSKQTEKLYPYNICRIRKNNTAMIYEEWKKAGIHLGIYIDIYPVDRIPDNKFLKKLQTLAIILMTPIRISRNPVVYKTGAKKFNQALKNLIYIFTKIAPKKLCDKIEHYFLTFCKNKPCQKNGIICEGGTLINPPKDMIPFSVDFMNEYTEVNFENHKLMCVANPEQLLEHWYGNYMELPPKEKQIMFHQPEIFDTKNSYEKYI